MISILSIIKMVCGQILKTQVIRSIPPIMNVALTMLLLETISITVLINLIAMVAMTFIIIIR